MVGPRGGTLALLAAMLVAAATLAMLLLEARRRHGPETMLPAAAHARRAGGSSGVTKTEIPATPLARRAPRPEAGREAARASPATPVVSAAEALSGHVLRPDGSAAPGAAIAVWTEAGAELEPLLEGTADEAGRFLVGPVDSGRYLVHARERSRAAARSGVFPGSFVVLRLDRAGALEGTLRDSAGVPLSGQVHLHGKEFTDFVATTDSAGGAFAFAGIPAGTYLLLGMSRGHAMATERVELSAGGRGVVDLTLLAGCRLRGRIVDAANDRPVAAAAIGHHFDLEVHAVADERGEFRLGGLACNDAHTFQGLRVEAVGYATTLFHVQPEAGGDPQAPSVLRLPPEVVVEGRLETVGGGGAAIAGVQVEATQVSIGPAAARLLAASDRGGRFRLRGLAPERPGVVVFSRPGYATATARLAAQPAGATVDLGTVTLEPGYALNGVVIDADSRPLIGLELEVKPVAEGGTGRWRKREAQIFRTTTDLAGEFVVSDLALAGRYTLQVVAPGYPQDLHPFSPGEADDHALVIRTSPIERAPLELRVADEFGDAVAGASVNVTVDGVDTLVRTDAEGRAQARAPLRGTADVSVIRPGFAMLLERVSLDDLQVRDVRLTLEGALALRASPPGDRCHSVLLSREPRVERTLRSAAVAGDRFEFAELPPSDRYVLTALSADAQPVATASLRLQPDTDPAALFDGIQWYPLDHGS